MKGMDFDNCIPSIPMKDAPLHTEERMFCDDPACPCHEEPALIGVVNEQYLDGLLTADEATRTIMGEQV